MNLQPSFRYSLLETEQIASENGTKTIYDVYSCCRQLGFAQT